MQLKQEKDKKVRFNCCDVIRQADDFGYFLYNSWAILKSEKGTPLASGNH